ncbi:hypothetical protein C8D70_10819 [Chryseobacterium sp. CBTAP 102]|nr:hypothetical protein C8D70_10819 [Chryseobacterium sp. CBTAP 102]
MVKNDVIDVKNRFLNFHSFLNQTSVTRNKYVFIDIYNY